MSEGDAQTIRKTLLEIYFNENVRSIKNLLARNIALVAQWGYHDKKDWAELLPSISQACESTELETRYKGVLLL